MEDDQKLYWFSHQNQVALNQDQADQVDKALNAVELSRPYVTVGEALRRTADVAIQRLELLRAAEAQSEANAQGLQDTMAHYKKRVQEVAMKYATTYDWCDQVRTALRELDIELEEPRVQATVTVTYNLVAKVPFDHLISFNGGPEHFVKTHLHVPSIQLLSDMGVIDLEEGEFADPAVIVVTNAHLKES